jgi:hypothetical protein
MPKLWEANILASPWFVTKFGCFSLFYQNLYSFFAQVLAFWQATNPALYASQNDI